MLEYFKNRNTVAIFYIFSFLYGYIHNLNRNMFRHDKAYGYRGSSLKQDLCVVYDVEDNSKAVRRVNQNCVLEVHVN